MWTYNPLAIGFSLERAPNFFPTTTITHFELDIFMESHWETHRSVLGESFCGKKTFKNLYSWEIRKFFFNSETKYIEVCTSVKGLCPLKPSLDPHFVFNCNNVLKFLLCRLAFRWRYIRSFKIRLMNIVSVRFTVSLSLERVCFCKEKMNMFSIVLNRI